jgi:hypothetical protein
LMRGQTMGLGIGLKVRLKDRLYRPFPDHHPWPCPPVLTLILV